MRGGTGWTGSGGGALVAALAALLAACPDGAGGRRAAGDSTPPTRPSGADPARPPARPVGPSLTAAAAEGDQVAPSLVALGDGWLVGWEEDRGESSRLVVVSAESMGRGQAPTPLAEADARHLELAASGDRALAAWLDGEGVRVRPVDAEGRPSGAARTLSGSGRPLGPPGVLGLAGAPGFVVAWVEGERVHVAEVAPDGSERRRTSWPGGNVRPWGRIRPPPEAADAAPPAVARAQPTPDRPIVVQAGRGVRVYWWGELWHSDDLGGFGLYAHDVSFRDDGAAEPEIVPRGSGLGAIVAAGGRRAAVQAVHDPNGGPWELALRDPGVAEPAPPFTSEPAGPLEHDLVATADGLVAAWASPSRGGLAVARLGPDGSTRSLALVAAPIVPGEAAVALAAGRGEVRAAFVTRVDGRPRVRLVDLAEAAPTGVEVPPTAPAGEALAATRDATEDVSVVALGDGRVVVVAEEAGIDRASARAFWLDASGRPEGEPLRLGPPVARVEGTASVAVGDEVVTAFSVCSDGSMCSAALVRLAVLRPGAAATARAATPPAETQTHPALATDGERLAMVTCPGMYGSGLSVRVVPARPTRSLAGRLAAARVATISEVDSNRGCAPAAAFTSAGLLVAFNDGEGGEGSLTRIFFFPGDGGPPRPGVTIPDTYDGTWGNQRLAALGEGAALAGPRARGRQRDVALYLLSPDGSRRTGTVVVGRGMEPRSPSLAVASEAVAVTWYDRTTDGVWVTFVGGQGQGRRGPLRLDDPSARASFGEPYVVPIGAGRFRGVWADPYTGSYALYHATIAGQ